MIKLDERDLEMHKNILKLTGSIQEIQEKHITLINNFYDQAIHKFNSSENRSFQKDNVLDAINKIQENVISQIKELNRDISKHVIKRFNLIVESSFSRMESKMTKLRDLLIENYPEFKILNILEKEKKRMKYSDLSKMLDCSVASIRKYVAKLERLGLVKIDKSSRPHTVFL